MLRPWSNFRLAALSLVLVSAISFLAGCGKNFYFAGRNLPPSGVTNRVLIAIQNPSAFTKGAVTFVDAYYDIRHAYNNANATFSISGASANVPLTIQNMPEEQAGAIYNSGDGSLSIINYSAEKQSTSIAGSPAASVFISRNLNYVVSADQTAHYFVVQDRVLGRTIPLNLPGVYRVSLNPSGTIALAFVQNSNTAYTLVHLTGPQQTSYQAYFASNGTWPANAYGLAAQDCEPQNLPVYCVYPVATAAGSSFDHPVKALFSPDGSSIYVLNCGPECGGAASGITTIPITTSSVNTPALGPAAINLQANATYPIPGGATNAIGNGTTLYVAGQSVQPDGYLAGNLTVFSFTTNQIEGTYSISDGTHNKMLFADDDTLFVGSAQCQFGERYHLDPSSTSGCLTMFNTSSNAVSFDTYKGDLTGIADVEGLHKIYVAEGGQIYIYRTTDFASLDNSDVTVVGTASDVAYMDGSSDANNTTY
jgi:hypothetical protein